MMSTTAGGGTSSGGREATMTGPGKERRDGETTGVTGNGTEAERGGAAENTETMTAAAERDSPHPDMR